MEAKKTNKLIAGFHILNIISTANNDIDGASDKVIRDYLAHYSPFKLNLDDELDQIIGLQGEELEEFFVSKASDYYDDSTYEERDEFLQFARTLIRADEDITREEGSFFKSLLRTWNSKDKRN
ncbi:MAG: TerB family tellurite resistance protein [Weeksellaceae bacterium]|nr:TerB family tellurite resistance protein [Weeksellaceae bacterium]